MWRENIFRGCAVLGLHLVHASAFSICCIGARLFPFLSVFAFGLEREQQEFTPKSAQRVEADPEM